MTAPEMLSTVYVPLAKFSNLNFGDLISGAVIMLLAAAIIGLWIWKASRHRQTTEFLRKYWFLRLIIHAAFMISLALPIIFFLTLVGFYLLLLPLPEQTPTTIINVLFLACLYAAAYLFIGSAVLFGRFLALLRILPKRKKEGN